MASARASASRVICLERSRAGQTLEKKTTTVMSSNMRKNVNLNAVAGEQGKSQYSAAPWRILRAVVLAESLRHW